jgi:hypothetical protein
VLIWSRCDYLGSEFGIALGRILETRQFTGQESIASVI